MEPSNSRLTFGYHLSGTRKGLKNLLGPEIQEFGVFLRNVSDTSRTGVTTFYSSHPNSGVGTYPSIRIKFEGPLASFEQALNTIVESQGVPDFVDQPQPGFSYGFLPAILGFLSVGTFRPLLVNLRGPAPNTPSTPDAYNMAKEVYKREKVGTTTLADDTLVPSSHGYI